MSFLQADCIILVLTSTSYICFLSLTFVLTRPDMTTTSHWEIIEIFMKDSGQIKVNEKIIMMDLLNNYTQYSGPHQWRVERLSLFIQAIYPVCTKQESLSLFWGSFLKTENATVPFNLSSLISLKKKQNNSEAEHQSHLRSSHF